MLVGGRVKHENLVLSNGLLKKIFNMLIGHFRVPFSLYFKANLSAKNITFYSPSRSDVELTLKTSALRSF